MTMRIGFIGCGDIARLHAACLTGLGAKIAGGYDVSAEAAERFARDFGGEPFADAERLCGRADIDAIYICTRHDSHVSYIEMAAERGKAVFCEKPLALSLEEARAAADIVNRRGVPFALGFNHRYSPGMQRLKNYLEERGAADAINVQFATAPFLRGWAGLREQGGGVLVCLGSHVFDLVRYLASSDIAEVRALSVRRRLPEPYLDDAFAAVMTTAEGQLITVNAHDYGTPAFATDPGHRLNTVHAYAGNQAATATTSHFECFDGSAVVREQYATDQRTAWGYMELNRRFLAMAAGAHIDIPGVEAGIAAAKMVELCRTIR